MDDQQIDDLKQFIAATVSQAIAHSESGIKATVEAAIEGLRQEMLDGFAAVAEALEPLQLTQDDHEQRITKLEQQV